MPEQEAKNEIKGPEDLWEIDEETLNSGACGYVEMHFFYHMNPSCSFASL